MASAILPAKARKGRPKRLTPIAVFEASIGDAERLIALNEALADTRSRRMRAEFREAIGNVLHVSQRDWDLLDRAESDHVLIIVKPRARCSRSDFDETQLRPLLRQAVVAIAAAVESYVAEKACGYVTGEFLRSESLPKGLESIPLTMGELSRWSVTTSDADSVVRRSYGTTPPAKMM